MKMDEAVLEALESQAFADFYNEDMDAYIVGEPDAPTKDEVLKKIRRIFRHVMEKESA